MINLNNETNEQIDIDFFKQIMQFFIKQENLKPETFVDLSIVDDETIKDINYRYRSVNKATDVLSFEFEDKNLPFLGDIIIDIYQIIRQKGKNTIKQELCAVFVHALLHLIGHDHLSITQKKIMEEKEKQYLTKLYTKKELFT